MGLLHQYPWVTHQHPWAKAAWLLMSARFVGMNVFHCHLEFLSLIDLIHQYPWAKANMAIDVRTICWDEYFSLSFRILSPTKFCSPADLSRGINVANGIS